MRRKLEEVESGISRCMSQQIKLQQERGILEKERLQILRGIRFSCPRCGKRSTLSRWVFIKTSYFVPPHGCTGGDYWMQRSPSECGIKCPRCKNHFYIPSFPQQEKFLNILEKVGPMQVALLFKCVEETEEEYLRTLCK